MIVVEMDVCAQLRTFSFKWSIKDFQGLDWQGQGPSLQGPGKGHGQGQGLKLGP